MEVKMEIEMEVKMEVEMEIEMELKMGAPILPSTYTWALCAPVYLMLGFKIGASILTFISISISTCILTSNLTPVSTSHFQVP